MGGGGYGYSDHTVAGAEIPGRTAGRGGGRERECGMIGVCVWYSIRQLTVECNLISSPTNITVNMATTQPSAVFSDSRSGIAPHANVFSKQGEKRRRRRVKSRRCQFQ